MAAVRDRDGQFSEGREQAFPVDGTRRIYRHTLTGLGSDGSLRPLADVLGMQYVGVSADAIFPQALPGRGTRPGDRRGLPLARVHQWGELELVFRGTPADADLGRVCYCVDDETVTTDPSELVAAYAVGRLSRRSLRPGNFVRVLISGFPCCCEGRRKVWLEPHTYAGLAVGVNYRVGVALPAVFEDVTYSAELLSNVAAVVVNRDTGPKTVDHAYWNLYVPTSAAPYGTVDVTVTPWFAGEGYAGALVMPQVGIWDAATEIL